MSPKLEGISFLNDNVHISYIKLLLINFLFNAINADMNVKHLSNFKSYITPNETLHIILYKQV